MIRQKVRSYYRLDETSCVEQLLPVAKFEAEQLSKIQDAARELVVSVRKKRLGKGKLDAFLVEYDLSSEEGIALLCLAESLLRIPDKVTRAKLIQDKISMGAWEQHLGKSSSWFVNAATWGLMLTGKLIGSEQTEANSLYSALLRLVKRNCIGPAIQQAMKILGRQFVMAETIQEGLTRAQKKEEKGYRYSYDMLGEAAKTEEDAASYFKAYQAAIQAIAKNAQGRGPILEAGVSVKLSALHPRYEITQKALVMDELYPRLLKLAQEAKTANINFTIDAEEADRLEISMDLLEKLSFDSTLTGWNGLGLAVQAYQKRAYIFLDWLAELAKRSQRRFMVRLVKGAYWDSEIKWAQERGMSDYPVFTRKASTDLSYLACAKKLLTQTDLFFPQFATHNAFTVATIIEIAGEYKDFEFQCLHGMGDALYDNLVQNYPCRVYAPVGGYENLLAYLVRRLLENGANTSFVNRIIDERSPIEDLIVDPVSKIAQLAYKPHPRIPLPLNLYGEERSNSKGMDLSDPDVLEDLQANMQRFESKNYLAMSSIQVEHQNLDAIQKIPVKNPANSDETIGYYVLTDSEEIQNMLNTAHSAFLGKWSRTQVQERVAYLKSLADALEENRMSLIYLLVKEAGKTYSDAVGEVREAVDYCRYYAQQAEKEFTAKILAGPTGELNQLSLHGRGVALCISPWNFPLAIFLGQVVAALVAGNTVIAKPALQTPLIAAEVFSYIHQVGIPKEVAQLLISPGSLLSEKIIPDLRIQAVIFTGSTQVAQTIQSILAHRGGPIIPFIAETGGQNAMIVDSSALAEQVVGDVIASAFGSAGQRCSALRILYLQKDIAPKILNMLKGAMAMLKIGDPSLITTDIGPVIDQKSKENLESWLEVLKQDKNAELLYQAQVLPEVERETPQGNKNNYVLPTACLIKDLKMLVDEHFGPILHVLTFESHEIDKVIDEINNTQYGLTLGIHSRINETVEYIHRRIKVGNTYVNRNMIGAVVGVQPFGGQGLSGTGPKAGGPYYLHRLSVERTLCINIAAAGGNTSLMSLVE
ncbi:MAG: bifunctional proline dehydrogenase/L-glutamate gamma-semialdehyde dehydrogenase PutA [Gammaproteobacteria bacterium]